LAIERHNHDHRYRNLHHIGCRISTNNQVVSGGTAAISWDQGDFDSDGFWTSGTDIIVPKGLGGIYLILIHLYWGVDQSGARDVHYKVNGAFPPPGTALVTNTIVLHAPGENTHHDDTISQGLSDVVELAAGDVVTVERSQSSDLASLDCRARCSLTFQGLV
jgi:hypothetical protein